MWVVIFIVLLIVLLFISQILTKNLSRLFLVLFKKQTVAIYMLSFLFLPGVILHELSHLLVASILFVPTGEIEFLPETQGSIVKMGSVGIAHTDPLRRFLIGVAPIIGGLGIFFLIASYLLQNNTFVSEVLLLYSSFEIANTMFSSKKDLEGAIELTAGILFLCFVLQLLGLPVVVSIFHVFQGHAINAFFLKLTQFLSIALGIDVFLILFTKGLLASRVKYQ